MGIAPVRGALAGHPVQSGLSGRARSVDEQRPCGESRHGLQSCDGVSRRDFLQVGTLGLGGLTLPWLLRNRTLAGSTTDFVNDKAVVLLFLSGGASHIETFNPNMDAPAPYYSVVGQLQTTLPGVSFGGVMPRMAAIACDARNNARLARGLAPRLRSS